MASPAFSALAAGAVRPSPGFLALAWGGVRRHRLALWGLGIIAAFALGAAFAPALTPYDPNKTDLASMLQGPGRAHPLGTDELGRDLLARLLFGGRISLLIGLAAVGVSVSVGTCVGAIAGYAGGRLDNVLMRLTDFFMAFPPLFVLILLTTVFGPKLSTIVLVIGALRWMGVARLVRAAFLSLREREFVEAARAMGLPPLGIALRHILPNALGPLVVATTLGVADAIVIESSLSFLGLGIQPPAATWGNLLRNAQDQVFRAPWTVVFPGLAIFLTVLSINHVGDALRDALDPKRT